MAELFLAIVACDAKEIELGCAVALGSDYRRVTTVPMPLADCLQSWRVPNVFSVCTIAVLFGEMGLGKVSVPIMSLGKHKNITMDEWYTVDPSNEGTGCHRLRLLLHLRQGEGEDSKSAPETFEQLCKQLLIGQEPSREPQELSPPSAVTPARGVHGGAKCEDLASDLEKLQRLCKSMLSPTAAPGTLEDPDSPREAKEGEDATSVYDEALSQLLAQKEALERESTELNTHWSALQADQAMKHEVLAEMQAERLSIQSTVEELQSEVLETTAELKEAQALASSRLANRRRLQAELTACALDFNGEAATHRDTSEALRRQRARLRTEAVELGKTLQGCVQRGDELVSENLHLRTESAEVEEAEERSASELNSFIACQPQLLQHCRQLWKAKAKPCDEKDRMRNASTGTEVEGRQSVDSEGDYASKIVSLKKAADRISCANGEARQAKKR